LGQFVKGFLRETVGKFLFTPIFCPPEKLGPKIVFLGGLEGTYPGSKFHAPLLKTGVRGLANGFKNFKISKQVNFRAGRTSGHVHLTVNFFTEFYTEQRELNLLNTDF